MAYVGQQIILNYKIYTTLDVRSYNFMNENEFDGFYVEQLRTFNNSYSREIIDGVEYFSKSIKKLALFPQQTGTYEIDPVDVNLGIATKNSSRGFFFSSQLAPRRIRVAGLNITVQNTPPGGDNFSGAVGQYEMQTNSTKRSITTDEAITVVMQIVGNGDNKTVQAPKWEVPDGIVMYDPNILEDEVFPSKEQIKHRKTFEYLLVAEKPGIYTLQPTFNYFDPDSSKYFSLQKRMAPINIIAGSKTNNTIVRDTVPGVEPIFDKTKLNKISSSWHGSLWHISILVLIGASLIGIFIINYFLVKSGKRDPNLIRKKKAYEVAQGRLEQALALKSNNDHKLFYEEISIAIKKYIEDKFQIPALHLNKNEFLLALEQSQLDNDTISELSSIIEETETAIYSPVTPISKDNILEKSIQVISRLET